MAASRYELQRIKRILWPSKYDYCAFMLLNAVGRWWFLLHGWKREYRVLYWDGKRTRYFLIDLAHPKLKLALEGDGEKWHMDVAREQLRDSILTAKGWSIAHYRYPRLKNDPQRVKREVRRWYWKSMLWKIRW